jgi:hypothetical protein
MIQAVADWTMLIGPVIMDLEWELIETLMA